MMPDTIITVLSFLFGLALGSFLNVCIHRIPIKKSIVSPPSSCTACGKEIRFYDNIPLVSYILLLGKCRHCREPIPIRYPLVELMTGLLSLALFVRYHLSYLYLTFLIFSAALVIISFIDLRHQIIPDVISLPFILLGLIPAIVFGHVKWYDSVIGIVGGGGILYLIALGFEMLTGKEGMGGGDIKLLAMIGSWLGWKAIPFVILTSSLAGIVIGGGSLLFTRQQIKTKIPFGPFLSIGALAYLFFGPEIISWYLRLIL